MIRSRWLPPALWAVALVTATSIPVPHVAAPDGTDKVVHVLLYGVLAVLVARAAGARVWRIERLLLVAAGISLFGFVDEWHQRFIPGRSQDHMDWLADTAGGITGLLLSAALRRRERLT